MYIIKSASLICKSEGRLAEVNNVYMLPATPMKFNYKAVELDGKMVEVPQIHTDGSHWDSPVVGGGLVLVGGYWCRISYKYLPYKNIKEYIQALFAKKYNYLQIAKITGLSKQYIAQTVRENLNFPNKTKWSNKAEGWKKRIDAGESIYAIANKEGCSTRTVHSWINK